MAWPATTPTLWDTPAGGEFAAARPRPSAVNIAAKLQSLAEGYQIAMSETTYRSAGVAELLAEQGATAEEMTYTSKALKECVQVRRWTVYRDGL